MSVVYRIEVIDAPNVRFLPVYIGVTHNAASRLRHHQKALGRGCEWRLYRVWRAAGVSHFRMAVIFRGSIDSCLLEERRLIAESREEARAAGFQGCLNVNDGGEYPRPKAKKKRKGWQKKRAALNRFGILVRNLPQRKRGWKQREREARGTP